MRGKRSKKVQQKRHSGASFVAAQKEDAMDLAQLLYDIFKEQKESGRLRDGQNNANQSQPDQK